MSETEERVAKALIAEWAKCGDVPFPLYQHEADALARAAIEALREPTQEMISATEYIEVSSMSDFVTEGAAKDVWRAMINA